MDGLTLDGSRCSVQGYRRYRAARWTVARHWILGLALALSCQSALAQAMYRIKPLGDLGGCTSYPPVANGFNDADQVAGSACNAHGDRHAYVWKNDGKPMVDLGPSAVGATSAGYAINASGLVAGEAHDSTGDFAFVSSGDGTPMRKIYDKFGGSYAIARAVNDAGWVTGRADTAPGTIHYFDAFVWKGDGTPMKDLNVYQALGRPTGEGDAINASGQIAGSATDGDRNVYAFVWKNDGSPVLDLGGFGGYVTFPSCINASGQIAGRSSFSGYQHFRAFLWSNDGSKMRDLGTIAQGAESVATALNNSGQVAGYAATLRGTNPHAFVWMNNGTPMKDLGTLGGTRSGSNSINGSGQVTGWANLAGDTAMHAFVWRNDGTKIQDLNTLIDPLDPLKAYVTLTNGQFVNSKGNILAQGTDKRTGRDGVYLLQGTVLTLTPRSLAFGNQPVNTSSAAKSVTVTNTSSKVVAVTSVALTGTASNQFSSTNGCGKSLAGHANCTIKVTFRPTSSGAKSAILNVNGGGGGLRAVTLTGKGT